MLRIVLLLLFLSSPALAGNILAGTSAGGGAGGVAPQLEGTPVAAGFQASATGTCPALTVAVANETIYIASNIGVTGSGGAPIVSSVSSTGPASTSWAVLSHSGGNTAAIFDNAGTSSGTVQSAVIYWAKAAASGTYAPSITWSASADAGSVICWAVSGVADPTSPQDSNASLAVRGGGHPAPPSITGFSTTETNTLMLYFRTAYQGGTCNGTAGPPVGWSVLKYNFNGNGAASFACGEVDYKIVSTPQSSLTVTGTNTGAAGASLFTNWLAIGTALSGPPALPAEEFVGPFPTWINAKTGKLADGSGSALCTPSTANGIADDTAAVQSCLNLLGATHPVLYLPGGTYRITSTLNLANQLYISVIGEDPAITTISWAGTSGGTMLHIDGVAYSRFNRLTFNGQNNAAIAVDQSKGAGGNFDTANEYFDDIFENAGLGLRCGAGVGGACAETAMVRDQFLNNSVAGVKMFNFNALDMFIWYSLFQNNTVGVTNDPGGAGAFNVYSSIFKNSTTADASIGNLEPNFNFHNNYSIGSGRFVSAGGIAGAAGISIKGNTILDTTDPLSIYVGNLGPVLLIDNTIRSLASVSSGPVVQVTGPVASDLFSMGNFFTASSPTLANGHYHTIQDQVVARSTVLPTCVSPTWTCLPTLPGTPPNNSRQIFEVTPGSTAAQIQAVINNAAASPTVKPVVHIQPGSYGINTTLTVPANSGMQIIGDGSYSQLAWSGAGTGPVLRLQGPSKVTLRDFSVDGNTKTANGIEVVNADQPGSRIFMEQPSLTLSTQNLWVDGADYTSIEAHNFYHSQVSSPNTSVKITGGPQEAAGSWQGGKTAIFSGASALFGGTGYDAGGGAHLLVDDTWFENGDPIIFRAHDLYTTITYSGARLGSDTASTNVGLANFRGNAALLNLLQNGNVAITGTGTGANVLGLGLVGPSSTFFSNTSGATTEFLNSQTTASPPAGQSTSPLTEVPSIPDPAFLTATLQDYRTFKPSLLSGLPAGVTDARFYRTGVTNANIGIHLIGPPPSLTSVNLSGTSSYAHGAADGTTIGNVTVTANGADFAGTVTKSTSAGGCDGTNGAQNGSVQLVGSNPWVLKTSGSATGDLHICVLATDATLVGSPKGQAFTILEVGCSQATAFLARTSGLDSTHTSAYTTMICGLVTDGIWTKFDALYILATSTTSIAVLNAVSTGHTITQNGSLTFTTDRGYNNVAGGAGGLNYLDLGFGPSNASVLSTSSRHMSFWSLTDEASANFIGGTEDVQDYLLPEYASSTTAYCQMGGDGTHRPFGTTVSGSRGLFTCTVTASNTISLYQNGSLINTNNSWVSAGLSTTNFHATEIGGNGDDRVIAAVSIGGALTATDATNLYNRLQVYLHAVGAI